MPGAAHLSPGLHLPGHIQPRDNLHTHSRRPLRKACSGRRCSYRRCGVRAEAATVKELPIFPLNVVAFPSVAVPLNIFEAR